MTTSPAALSLSLADIAALAQVQRPVVTTWRSRSRSSAQPFPESVDTTGGQERFAVDDVVAWLTATGRGNNPHAATEAVLHAEPVASADETRRHADTLTALLALSAARGTRLTGLSRAELLDAADTEDPDDACLYREIAAIPRDMTSDWTTLADRTADAAWNAEAAVELVITDAGRPLGAERASTALSGPARDLTAALAAELASSQAGTAAPVLVDHTPGGSDALVSILERAGDAVDPVVDLASDDDAGRLTRRRLCARRRAWTTHRRDGRPAAALHLLQVASTTGARDAMPSLEEILLDLTDADRALVLGPASLLVDARPTTADTGRRADLLRTGRVRCTVRLAAGLLPARSREALALWVLGPATSWPAGEDQFTLVADLTGRQLDDVVIGDLVSDVAATLSGAHGDRDQFAARAFRFGRLVPTRTLVATDGALVTSTRTPHQAVPHSADHALAVERLLTSVAAPLPGLDGIEVAVADAATRAPTATVEALIAAGHLRCLSGTRVAIDADATSGTRVLDARSLSEREHRYVDLLAFTRAHPTARLTEPGDVAFTTTGTSDSGPAAVVDVDGGAVVAFPARILRIDAADPGGLNPVVLAADITAQHAGDRRWQQWRVHRVSDAESAALTATLARVEAARQESQRRLADLRELTRALVAGVSAGTISLNPSPEPERTN